MGRFQLLNLGGFGLWVRVEVLGIDCGNRFPNTNHNRNHNSNDYLTLTSKSNPELTLTLTLTLTATITITITLTLSQILTQTLIINYNPPNQTV